LGTLVARAALLLLPVLLAGCAGSGDGVISFTDDRGVANQPFPVNYRLELQSFLKSYLNNPVGIRDAEMAEPVQRTVGGRLRFVSCLRYNVRESDGSYRGIREHAVAYVDGRLDRMIENFGDACAGVTYVPFPELEKLVKGPA
jgi:hypothetical protein